MWRSGERRSCETEYEKDSRSLLAESNCSVRSTTRFSSSSLMLRIRSSSRLASVMSRLILAKPRSSPLSSRRAISTECDQYCVPSLRVCQLCSSC
ncbi:hypothetical protein D9M68_881300 [compost metagenome]